MNPSGMAFIGFATLNTATLLASALATNSIWPSGEMDKLDGVLPLGPRGCNAQLSVCSVLPLLGSRTVIAVELAHATYKAFSSLRKAISVGCDAVGQRS